jgi:hypothetical protein
MLTIQRSNMGYLAPFYFPANRRNHTHLSLTLSQSRKRLEGKLNKYPDTKLIFSVAYLVVLPQKIGHKI